jgi:hypothetical protein
MMDRWFVEAVKMPSTPSVKRAAPELHPATIPPIAMTAAPRRRLRSSTLRTLKRIVLTRAYPTPTP